MKEIVRKLDRIIFNLKKTSITECVNLEVSIASLVELQELMKFSDYDCVKFLEYAKTKSLYQTWIAQDTRKLMFSMVSLEEVREEYTDCAYARTEFDGEYLSLLVYWFEDDLLSDDPTVYVIKVEPS